MDYRSFNTMEDETSFLRERVSDGGFLQSEEWRRFQEVTGKKTFHFFQSGVWANVIEHTLPWVGTYWYVPRGPVLDTVQGEKKGNGDQSQSHKALHDLVESARKHKVAWIRIEPNDHKTLRMIRDTIALPVEKSPHDMQPKEILVLSLEPEEEEILGNMKSKTRYNIRLAEKKGVRVFVSHDQAYRDIFCDLVEVTAKRDGIVSHPRAYYQKMMTSLPSDRWTLSVAEYEGKVLAVNLVVTFGSFATYLHGASGNEYRHFMAPYALQWRQIRDAKAKGCRWYDFGGVTTQSSTWAGITRFKQGFAPDSKPVSFPGAYDIVIDARRYDWYRRLRLIKSLLRRIL